MSSNNLGKISTIVERLNEFFPSPICSTQLTNYSKIIQKIKKTTNEFEKAGRRQKRSLKGELEQLEKESEEFEEECLKCVFNAITSELKQYSDNQTQALSAISPQAVQVIRDVKFPITSEFDTIELFIESFTRTQKTVLNQVKDVCNNLLVENKMIVKTYSDLIQLDQSSYQQTSTLTSDALNVMKLEDIVAKISVLRRENALLSEKLSSSSDNVQERLLLTVHDLISAVQEGGKQNIIPDMKEYESINDLKVKIENTDKLDELRQLNREVSSFSNKYSSLLKSEINHLRAEGNNMIVNIWMPEPPSIMSSSAPISELIMIFRSMNKWKNQILDGIKNISSSEEVNQVAEGFLQEGLTISNTLLINLQENAQQVQDSLNLEEAFHKIKNYHVYYSEFLRILREKIQTSLDFEATDSISSSMIALKPPQINLKSDSPTELFSYVRAVNSWKQKLVNVLQETRHVINDTIVTINQLEKKGIPISSSLKSELKDLYNKIQVETEVPQLLNFRRTYDHLYKQFVNLTAANIKDFIKDVTIIQVLELEDIPKAPFVEDASELDLSELLERIELIEKWKLNVLTTLRNKVDTLAFPLIPGDVPVDLRKEKLDLVNQMSSSAATRNFVTTIKSYFSFMNTVAASTDIMIEETRKQIKYMEKMDASSMKYFKKIVSSAPIFEIPSDLEDLDYSAILELWHRLNTYNKKKLELIQLKCKEIISGWIKQYKSLPKHYLSTFNSLFMVLEQAISEINHTLDAEQTLTKFEFFIDGSTSKALESLEKLKSRFYNKTAVTIPRINEIMGELSPEILSVQNFLESTISTKGKDLESIYRLTIETIHDYEYVLIAKLMELLNISSRNLLTRISQLQSSGINIQSLVGEQIEVFSQLLQADTSDMMSIEMITQSFVELDKIYGNEELQKALFKIIDETSTNAGRILDFIQALGWKNTQTTILPHVVAIRQSRSSIQFWSFDLISKAAIDVNAAAKELSKAIYALENRIYEEYQIELANDSTLPYYPSIIKIFEFKFEDCSRNIFPLQELYETRKKLQESENLEEIYKLLAIIAKLTTQWKNECLPKLSRWHRVLFLFISDYQPTSIQDEKISFIANARREIEDTYNNQELIQYLNSAVEYYVSAR
ncbi:MAG: hypothetical protein ACW964_10175 [Candidatus Hodarchaeales archaeon]|jgi:biotin operon repressor